MTLYLLKRIGAAGREEYEGFVLRAGSPEEARQMALRAALPSEEEFAPEWLDPERTSCESLSAEGERDILLAAFKAGQPGAPRSG
jgi:hypothetical protein